MHHSDMIRDLVKNYKPGKYVELGLYEGETLSKVQPFVKECIGVDLTRRPELESLEKLPNVKIMYCSTDDFFKKNINFDMIFIDANHSIENVKRDFENALCLLRSGGIILLHDTDPEDDLHFAKEFCGDSYKIVKILEHDSRVNIVTIPIAEAGLSLVTKKDDTRTMRRHK